MVLAPYQHLWAIIVRAGLDVLRSVSAGCTVIIRRIMTDARWADIIPIDEHAALCLAADESGSPLLEAIVDGTTLERLAAAVERLYAGCAERLAGDVDRLLDAYSRSGYVAD